MKLRFRSSNDKKEKKQSAKSTNTKDKDNELDKNNFNNEITKSLNENVSNIKTMLGEPSDLTVRELTGKTSTQKCAILYIGGLVDEQLVQNNIIKTIQENLQKSDDPTIDHIYEAVIAIAGTKKAQTLDEVSYALLSGSTILYLDGYETALLISAKGGEKRSIDEPPSEALIRGPREGFIEDIHTNIAMVRRILKDPNLRIKTYETGKRSKQKIAVIYVAGITNEKIVDEVNRRLKSMDTDYALSAGHVEQWIQDSFLSPFPQLLETERPDRIASSVLQGKVGILVEGTPVALLAPIVFADTLKSLGDYSQRWMTATIWRLIRYLSAFIAMFAPALYIALVSYHPEMLPTKLVFSIQASREGVPFPAVIEAFLMAITFDILHEAGVRLPKLIGSTIGIVGGLVIGESAVSAGIVSPIMVIVTALTAIASFTTPQYSVAISFRNLRYSFMFAAAILGLFGIVLVYIMINIHMVNLKSFGTPYTTPFAPVYFSDWKDLFIRSPLTMLGKRPSFYKTKDKKKLSTSKGRNDK
ncbi:spore germination protein [Salirhabdus sp. Marseille-P4669]|uniref:spore germination protein n=1 Tax=Salirhabdus sp. Marseille-P4669 TaxID=2042310 RepID=UPI000C7E3760|nr:spore germination protein [Salirhabdus sp. Marseille-P4669]